ncbi:hypothetical protein ACLB2K_007503 [Fragaria x ananassa]
MILGDGLYHVLYHAGYMAFVLIRSLRSNKPEEKKLSSEMELMEAGGVPSSTETELMSYIIAPVLAFCNAYGCGLTDWSLASNYGKIAILIVSALVGEKEGGVIGGLASCGVTMSIVSTASDLMQDFKIGFLTLSSPRSMFLSQVLGTAM